MKLDAHFGMLPMGAFEHCGNRRIRLHGGVSNFVSDTFSGASDLVSGAVDAVGDVGKSIDTAVRNDVPGGWATVGAAALGAGAMGAFGGEAAALGADAAGYEAGAGGTNLFADAAIPGNAGELAGYGGAGSIDLGGGIGIGADGSISGGTFTGGSGLTGNAATDALTGLGGSSAGLGNIAKSLLGDKSGSGLTGSGALAGLGGLAGALALINSDKGKYGVPGRQAYNGPMSQFKYSPSSFTPTRPNADAFKPQGAPTAQVGYGAPQGGLAGLQPQQQQNPYMQQLMAMRAQAQQPGQGTQASQFGFANGGQIAFAQGGASDLGGYSDGGRMLKGPGDGMSDSIPASIAGKQPARLANDEFVVPADVVSHLGNGSSDAGAKVLYKMMDRVRQARTGNKNQGKQINPAKYTPK